MAITNYPFESISSTSITLITAGNPNLSTLANVLLIVQAYFQAPIDSVFLIDTDGSTTDTDGASLESKRNELIRKYTHSYVRIAQRCFPTEQLATAIPQIVSEELRRVSPDRVVVDLTNGTKTLSSLLYASASLLQLKHLFFLTLLPSGRGKAAEDLVTEDYRVDVLHPLEDVNALKPLALFELVYYQQEMLELMSLLAQTDSKHSEAIQAIEKNLQDAVRKYFAEDPKGSVQAAGQASEWISTLACEIVNRESSGVLLRGASTQNFADRIKTIQSRICNPLHKLLCENGDLQGDLGRFLPFLYLSSYLDLLRIMRNDTSHARRCDTVGKEEARLALDLVRLAVRALGSLT